MGADGTAMGARLAEAWRANWSYLVGLAFGMLGDIGAAEDAVQEAFARLASTEPGQVDDARGWLIVVTSRICLDQIRSARSQRDRPHDATAIESAGVPAAPALPVDPADRVTLDDQVRLALLVVLDRLTPAERVAFILHDVFQMPFAGIAQTLGKSAATCRQLARRARTKIQSRSPRRALPADTSQHRQVAEQFIKACSGGDLETLLGLLDPDIWGDVDLGPLDARTGQTERGPLRVAGNLLRYFGSTTTLVSNPVAGPAVVLAFAGQRLSAVILLTIEGERIRKIHVIADPAKVGFLSSQLGPALRAVRCSGGLSRRIRRRGYCGLREAAMRAWHVDRPGPVGLDGGAGGLLVERETPVPEPGPGELLLRVLACGVCRTDLHVTEGDLPVHRPGVTPGHEVVGEVVAAGPGDMAGFAVGDRAGAAWLRSTDGTCRYCARGSENLCPASRYTGWDADGGYAEYLTVPAAYAHPLPRGYSDAELAPLLCAGIIGYRALKRAALPPGGRLGLYGFGGSAHLAAQVALAQGASVYVMTRGTQAQELAKSLGAAFVGGAADMPPEPLDSAILFAPVGDLVLPAMAALDRGGTLAIAGIYLTDIPPLSYDKYLFEERQLRSVTSNTREDAREFLGFAAAHKLSVTTHPYPLDAADRALADLKAGRFDGAAVLVP